MNLDIDGWLRGIGLGRYAEDFRANGIDGELLSRLTNDDLRDIGVVSLGHRKKLLRAIATLAPASGSVALSPGASRDAAERRQLTAMFVDLVGSTALSSRLDPEDMHEVITTYQQCCAGLIAANGGFVAGYMGDGVLAYFGYPQAHEHDAERAVRAGLEIAEATPKLQTAARTPLHVRLGIATGIVVVGDLFGLAESREPDVVGETPNLAARLQRVAKPDGVVVAESTRRLLGDLFELDEIGPHELKDIAGPTRVWAAVRASSQASRFDALHSGSLTPLVGREEEIELLVRCWRKAKEGQGQVVLLSGEAGIGKSRLTAAFLERLTDEPYARLRYFCSPQHTDSAFYPVIGHLTRRSRLARGDDVKTKLDKLDALLALSVASREDAALVAEMLSLPNDGRYPELDLAPPQRRQKAMEALTARIGALSQRSPVLIIFEDAHWADPSSLEAFSRVLDQIGALRALMLVTSRPEFEASWVDRPHVTALTIDRLAPDAALSLIDHLAAGRKALPENIRQDIVDRSDCVPLFIEEITKAVLEAESEAGAAPAAASVYSSRPLTVPASLHASLMARLDRLGTRQGRGANRRRDRPGVFLRAAGPSCGYGRAGAAFRARAASSVGPLIAKGIAAARDLSFQARAGSGCGLWNLAARASTRPACPDRGSLGNPVCRLGGERAGTAGAPLDRSRSDREGFAPMGQSGPAVVDAFCARRSENPVVAGAGADCDIAGRSRLAAGANQAPGRPRPGADAQPGLCGPRNQASVRTSADVHGARRSFGRAA